MIYNFGILFKFFHTANMCEAGLSLIHDNEKT